MVYEGRDEEMNPEKAAYAQKTDARTLDEVIDDADVFLGLSAGGILKPEMVKRMAAKPLILALANPDPEINPDDARAANPDAVIATGRSDYPNQVNNVLCFPFIFRGALDVRATTINEEMKLAAVRAIANLAKAESSEVVAQAYQGEELVFGADYLIPKPFDLRLIVEVAAAVAEAAMDSGVAKQPIEDFERYRERLGRFVFRSGMLMKPVFERARRDRRRLVFAEGEDERILRALQVVVDDGIARPILVGRPDVVVSRIEKLGLRLEEGRDFSLTNPESDPRYDDYWRGYHRIMERRGVSPDLARTIMRTNSTVIAAMMMQRGEADAMICGTYGHYGWHLKHVLDVVGMAPGIRDVSAISALIVNKGTFFICDTQVTPDPSMEEIVEMTILGADVVRRFGMNPKVALISHSNFGNADTPSARKMRAAVVKLRDRVPDMEVEGEMHADSAVSPVLRQRVFPNARLSGAANLLVYPNLEAANGAFNLLKAAGDGLPVGPLLVGAAKPVHIVTPSISARGLVNMSALAVVDSQSREGQKPLL